MTSYEIYWDDLTEEAKERLSGMYHDNIELLPIAIVNVEDEEEDTCLVCGEPLEVAMVPDQTGNGLHEETKCINHDCPDNQ